MVYNVCNVHKTKGLHHMQNKIQEAAELAEFAVVTWAHLHQIGEQGRAITVRKLHSLWSSLNKYQSRQLQQMMWGMGLLDKRENGRFYLAHKPKMMSKFLMVASGQML